VPKIKTAWAVVLRALPSTAACTHSWPLYY
jgi:hypothetical protein